jgi:hypothetical protein
MKTTTPAAPAFQSAAFQKYAADGELSAKDTEAICSQYLLSGTTNPGAGRAIEADVKALEAGQLDVFISPENAEVLFGRIPGFQLLSDPV